ncbi:WD40 repeat-like protein [Lichtheimia hyalospora FSU 10163]|nr:WD40 repeat-like protein [Lichtheimia hyalospora FSU 10163]
MHIYTGDESGLVKSIVFPSKQAVEQALQQQQQQRQKKKAKKDQDTNEPQIPTPIVQKFGRVDKNATVQHLCWGVIDGKRHLVVARKNGKVQYMCPETGAIVREYVDENVGVNKATFIGLHANDTYLITGASTGHISYTRLEDYNASSINTTTCVTTAPGADLCIMRVHPSHPHLFATGGKENDLKLFDANIIMQEDTDDKEEEEEEKDEKRKTRYQKAKAQAKGLIFMAKNVSNDMLDLRVPVWIQDLQFLNEQGTRIATATHYHQIRVYDIKEKRRPIHDHDVGGKLPLTNLAIGKNYQQLIFTDTMNTVRVIDVETGRTLAQYKGLTGSCTAVAVAPAAKFSEPAPEDAFVITVSLDRFARVHETKTTFRKVEHKLYLKQRMTCLLVDDEFMHEEEQQQEADDEEDEEDQAMWEAMETVDDNKKRKHRA